jgi:hypothetical protein
VLVGSGAPDSKPRLFLRRRKNQSSPTPANAMNAKGIVTPIPILAPDERPLVEGEDEPGLDPAVAPITSVMAAELWSVNVEVYGVWPEGIVVVVKNVVRTSVSVIYSATVTIPPLSGSVIV